MLYEVEGDLTLSRAQVIAHGVAVGDPMVRGVARKLHRKFPAMVEAYNDWCEEQSPEPGKIWLWSEPGRVSIANLITHAGGEGMGRADKIATNRCFKALALLARERRFKSIAMPKVGTGHHGLDWRSVLGMMDSQLGSLTLPVFIYSVELDGQVGSEPF